MSGLSLMQNASNSYNSGMCEEEHTQGPSSTSAMVVGHLSSFRLPYRPSTMTVSGSLLPGVSQGIPPRVGAVQITQTESSLQPTSAIRPEQRPTPSRLEQRPDPPIINRNVDSNEEPPRITLAETYNSSFSSPEQSHDFIIEETVQSRIRTDGSSHLNPSPRASSSISDNVALSSSNAVSSHPEHTLSQPRHSSSFEHPQFSTSTTEHVQPVASLIPKPLDKSTSNRISPVPVSTDQSQEIQPSNSFFVPVQAIEQTPRTQFETTVSETHSDAVASSVQVFGHPESHQPRQGDRTEASYAAENEPDYREVQLACQFLHAGDHNKMVEVLSPVRSTVAVSFGLGLAFYKMKKFQPAIQHFTKMEEMAYSDNRKVGNVYLGLYYRGEICFSKQNYLQAAELFHRSVAVYSSDTVAPRYRITPPSKSTVYAKEGASFRHGQRILEAVKAYKNAISTAENKRDKLSASTSLGNMYQSLGENVLALAQYETTIALATELQDHVSLGWAHGNMGNAYLGLQQKDKALHHLKEALELAVTYEITPQAIGRTYNNLGTAYQSMNDLDKAEEYYDLALSQAVYGNDAGGQARVYGNFGNVLMLKKEYDRAIVHYTEAYNLSSDRATKTTALHNRGCASYEKGETNKKKHVASVERSHTSRVASVGGSHTNITYDGPNMGDCVERRPDLSDSVLRSYRNGHNDLSRVIERHEEAFQTIKGSTHGLTLSVSLFESNSRTFHRVQDCLFNLGELEKALEYAEQSRTRSLGELMFERCGKYQADPLSSPLKIDTIREIVKSLKSEKVDVVYISYTGARIIVWVISPINSHVVINMFQVSLQDDQFEGKSLDYFLRYSLSELLIENHVELYSFCDYARSSESKHLSSLYDIFGKPLLNILRAVRGQRSIYDIILITDSYTYLMPVVTLYDSLSRQFLGDRLRVRYMPSLLTMGIMTKMPKVIVDVSEESQKFCIVGNPTIPMFQYQGETWRLGKLPFATKEAEWVAHILKTTPTLHEQATKMIILSMINSAKIVHLATHGSATAGFLAFAGLGSSRTREVTNEKTVLLYPEEVEKLHISPALVVLSSCDSGRGTVKADGIQGMARAFILAGAQSVLTTLWRIHDESASTFMKFFYQYLMDGFRSSVALHKASLSLRCFAKYSHYVHWSGFQLTGREIQLNVHMSSKDRSVLSKIGITPPFPRLDIVKKLETAFLKDPATPTDVQLVHGFHGLKPSEPIIDFVKKHHTHFTGGVFFVSGAAPEFVEAAEDKIKDALLGILPLRTPLASTPHILVIFDNISTIPLSTFFKMLLKNTNTHIIVTLNATSKPKDLVKTVDRELIRGTNVIDLKPLASLHATQRLVHAIMKGCDTDDFIPYNEEQKMLSLITEHTGGCPDIIDVTATVCAHRLSRGDTELRRNTLEEFSEKVIERQDSEENSRSPEPEGEEDEDDHFPSSVVAAESEAASKKLLDEDKPLRSATVVGFTSNLLRYLDLPQTDYFLLMSLQWFGPIPIPRELIEALQSLIKSANKDQIPTSKTPLDNLLSAKLLRVYPSTMIVKPTASKPPSNYSSSGASSYSSDSSLAYIQDSQFYYIPQLIGDAIRKRMEPIDRDFSLTAALKALKHFSKEEEHCDLVHAAGLANVLSNQPNEQIVCFQEIYRLYLSLKPKTTYEKQTFTSM